jgi:long-subunit acyl-CoA synthetase (AMP-forming)
MRRVDPERLFLRAGEQAWSYGEALADIEHRLADQPRLSQPSLTPEHVFDIVAGLSGGLTLVGPEPETTMPAEADLVVYTSGTSGKPKGVRLTRSNLEAAARASTEHLRHDADDNWLLAMPLHHVGGLSIVVRQMYTGGSITMLESFEPTDFAKAMHGETTMVSVVPTMLRRLISRGPFCAQAPRSSTKHIRYPAWTFASTRMAGSPCVGRWCRPGM